ncbi:PTS galactosamine transporter subunit IIB [Propionispora vibrioides]|jgi:PTS system galactosamine-specific IIB component|nr:PTS galactosamine transporter subunit IIB [Propionispora vibrioides]
MMAPNILLTRIDNRLVHGQVGVIWTGALGANLLVVVDDETAGDPLQQQLMTMTAEASSVGVRFFTVAHTIQVIHKAAPSQKIFIVCRTPAVVRQLVEGGVPIQNVNVGNMHFSPGKKAITKKVYVDDNDLENLRYLQQKGIQVFVQDTPGDVKFSID